MKTFATLVVAGLIGATGYLIGYYQPRPAATQSTTLDPQLPVFDSHVLLVVVVLDGTRVYRIEGEHMVVPAVLAVSPNGHVAFR